MGRTIIAEDTIENQLGTLYNKDKWLIGLIIGQTTKSKDYVLYLAPTPKSDSEEVISKSPKNRKGYSLDSVDESWLVVHARQVLRMLPGGLDILGVFGMAAPDMMKAALPKLRQILFAIQKVSSQSQGGSTCSSDRECSGSTDRIVLQICPQSRKLTCRTFDITDNKSSAKPAEWKFQRTLDRWHRLETSTALQITIPVHNTAMSQTLEKQILRGIRPMCDNVWNSVATIDNQVAAGDGPLSPSQPQAGKKGKKHQQEESGGQTFSVQLYGVHPAVSREHIKDPKLTPCAATLSLRGTMSSRAFVHAKATLDEAVEAVKTDIVRTLTSRCELLCEDLLQSEEDQDPKVLYETPLRVFAPLKESSIQLCDYMFQDETNNDVVDRFKELLDLHIPEDMVETDCERIPDEADLMAPETPEEIPSKSYDATRNVHKSSNMLNIIVIALSVVALLFAILAAFLYQNDSSG